MPSSRSRPAAELQCTGPAVMETANGPQEVRQAGLFHMVAGGFLLVREIRIFNSPKHAVRV